MRNFEVLQRTADRWSLAAIFDDAALAIADAKTLMARSRIPIAVRVVAVDKRDSEFVEWAIYHDSTFAHDVSADATVPQSEPAPDTQVDEGPEPPPSLPKPEAPRPRRMATKARVVSFRIGHNAALLLVILALGAIVTTVVHQTLRRHDVWIFDTPEAQKPHALRNPWTGETSR